MNSENIGILGAAAAKIGGGDAAEAAEMLAARLMGPEEAHEAGQWARHWGNVGLSWVTHEEVEKLLESYLQEASRSEAWEGSQAQEITRTIKENLSLLRLRRDSLLWRLRFL